MAKKRVFVSFDFDNDKNLKELLVGQSRNDDSPFEIIDHSLKEAAPESNWLEKARAAIGRAEVFIVLLGVKTRHSSGVLKEVEAANDLHKRKFQLFDANGNENWAVPNGGRPYRWTWENLKHLLS